MGEKVVVKNNSFEFDAYQFDQLNLKINYFDRLKFIIVTILSYLLFLFDELFQIKKNK